VLSHCWLCDKKNIKSIDKNLCQLFPKALFQNKWKKQTKRSEQPKFIRKALLTNCTQTDTFSVTEKPSEVTANPLTEMLGWDGSGSTISTKFTGNMPRPFPVVPDIHSALTQLSSITTSPAYTAITI